MIIYNETDMDDLNFWCKDSETTFMNVAAAAAKITAVIARVDDGTTLGFSLPSDSDVNEDSKVYVGIAWRE